MERVLSFMKIELQLLSLILKSKLSWVKLLLPSSTVCACTGGEKTSVGSCVGSLLPRRDWKEHRKKTQFCRTSYCWTRKQKNRQIVCVSWRLASFSKHNRQHIYTYQRQPKQSARIRKLPSVTAHRLNQKDVKVRSSLCTVIHLSDWMSNIKNDNKLLHKPL
jgi:hypothetical protein